MKLKTLLFGKTYEFRDLKDVLAKANEEKSGDKLAGVAAESAEERVAAKVVLSEVLLSELREHPVVLYEEDEVTRARVSKLLFTPPSEDTDQIIHMAQDCVRSMRLTRMDARIQEIMRTINSLSGEDKRSAMAEVTQLTRRINELKKAR